jgi:hypothetical protein
MSKPPSFHFTLGISITGFFGLFTWNKQLICHEQLRATAHQLIEHCTKGMAYRANGRPSAPLGQPSNQNTGTSILYY